MSEQVSEHDGQPPGGQGETKRDRQKRRRHEQQAQQEQQRQRQRRRGVLTAAVAVVAVAVVFGVAVLIAGDAGSGDGGGSGGSDPSGGEQGGGTGVDDVATASVAGSGLSRIPGDRDAPDPAVGADAPDVTGESFAGQPTTLGTPRDGAQAIVLVAHWCAHCQAEIPEVVQWVDDGLLPSDVELVAVSTLHRPDQGNWPPDTWLAGESWPGQVLADPDNSVAQAYGLAATPSWVFVDGDGEVAQRVGGRMSRQELQRALTAISD